MVYYNFPKSDNNFFSQEETRKDDETEGHRRLENERICAAMFEEQKMGENEGKTRNLCGKLVLWSSPIYSVHVMCGFSSCLSKLLQTYFIVISNHIELIFHSYG